MVHSNERGRALEYRVAIEVDYVLKNSLKLDVISSENTNKLNNRDKAYFDSLDEETKLDFSICAATFAKWLVKQDYFTDSISVTIDRFGDDKAKNQDPTDIQLGICNKKGILTFKNFSLKHHHDALKHPRLPSLAQQCGFKKGSKEDIAYRKKYAKIWETFGNKVKKLNKKIKVYSQINSEFKIRNLYVPLMKHTVSFLLKYKKNSKQTQSLFEYLVGKSDYAVIKNEPKEIVIKQFCNETMPTAYSVTYPYKEKDNDPRNYFLLEFNNGWKIRVRIHNASSRIFKSNGEVFATEKMDPICINIDTLIWVRSVAKK